jgi:hypothetical protein
LEGLQTQHLLKAQVGGLTAPDSFDNFSAMSAAGGWKYVQRLLVSASNERNRLDNLEANIHSFHNDKECDWSKLPKRLNLSETQKLFRSCGLQSDLTKPDRSPNPSQVQSYSKKLRCKFKNPKNSSETFVTLGSLTTWIGGVLSSFDFSVRDFHRSIPTESISELFDPYSMPESLQASGTLSPGRRENESSVFRAYNMREELVRSYRLTLESSFERR